MFITEVEVKYEDNGEEGWSGSNEDGEPIWNEKIELKVNPNNTINIKLIKNSWNREEVTKLCMEAIFYGFEHSTEDNNGSYNDRDNNEDLLNTFVTNFIKENL